MFLILSADPTLARNSVLRDPKAYFRDKMKPISLAEILSWAADGFNAGREHSERGRFPRCPYGLYNLDGRENTSPEVAPLRVAWNAWLEGFEQGLKENPRKPQISHGRWGDYKVIEYA
jgi:hypothetical protein